MWSQQPCQAGPSTQPISSTITEAWEEIKLLAEVPQMEATDGGFPPGLPVLQLYVPHPDVPWSSGFQSPSPPRLFQSKGSASPSREPFFIWVSTSQDRGWVGVMNELSSVGCDFYFLRQMQNRSKHPLSYHCFSK